MYCDNYWPMQMDRMWRRFVEAGAPAMLTVYANKDNYTKHTLKLDEAGFVTVYDKIHRQSDLQGTEISLAIFRKELVGLLPDTNVSLEETLFPVLIQNRQLAAFVTHHRYYSIGDTPRPPITEAFLARRPVIILDRDGVLNEKPPRANYVRTWEEFKWLPGAGDDEARLKFAGGGFNCPAIRHRNHFQNPRIEPYFTAIFTDEFTHLFGNSAVIHDALLRHVDRRDARGVRLDFLDLFRRQSAQTLKPVRIAVLPEIFQTREFVLGRGNDDLAALLVRNAMFTAKRDHLTQALDTETGFIGPGFVVKAGMKHAAVVAGLMHGKLRFLFQKKQARAGTPFLKPVCGCQPDRQSHHPR